MLPPEASYEELGCHGCCVKGLLPPEAGVDGAPLDDAGVEGDKEAWDNCNSQADCVDPKPNAYPTSDVTIKTHAEDDLF